MYLTVPRLVKYMLLTIGDMHQSSIDPVVRQNLKDALERSGRSAYSVATAIGHAPNWLYRVLGGKSGILLPTLREVADELGVSLGSLVDPPAITRGASADTGYIEVKELAAATGAGSPWDETVTGHLAFQQSWLKRHNIHPDWATVIRVRGDSMQPTLLEDDSILVDTSRTARREGFIFVVMLVGPGVVVKRAACDDSGEWLLVSDNPVWTPISWAEDALTIGEVRWVARSL